MLRPWSQFHGTLLLLQLSIQGTSVHSYHCLSLVGENRGLILSPDMESEESSGLKAARDTAHRKHSYLTAGRRSLLWGHSSYRGRRMTEQALQTGKLSTTLSTTSHSTHVLSQLHGLPSTRQLRKQSAIACQQHRRRPGQKQRHVLKLLCWNCGGMNLDKDSTLYDDFLSYMNVSGTDVPAYRKLAGP